MPRLDDEMEVAKQACRDAIHACYESAVEPEVRELAITLCLAYLEEHGGGDCSSLVSMFEVLPKGGMNRYLISMDVHPAWYDFVHMAKTVLKNAKAW